MSLLLNMGLANLPAGWTSDRLKDVATLRGERSSERGEAQDYLELEDIESGTGQILQRRNTLEVESDVTLFERGDILFGKLRPYLEKYYEAEFDGKCTGEILAFRPDRIYGRFLFYCLASRWFINQCNTLAYGAKMPRVNWPTQLALINLPLPPPPEQRRIATYLDACCSAIDGALESKARQIVVLDSLHKEAAHSAFAPLMAGAVERIKDVTIKISSGLTPDGGSSTYVDEGIPFLRSQNVYADGLRLEDVAFISEETHAEMANSQLLPRDVLINITGASIGRCTFVPEGFGEGNVNQHVCILRPGPLLNHEFLACFLASPLGQDQVLSSFTGASRQGLSHKEVGLIRIPLPGLQVQERVCGELKTREQKIVELIENIDLQRLALQGYRKSLIQECVIGQRQVSDEDVRRLHYET